MPTRSAEGGRDATGLRSPVTAAAAGALWLLLGVGSPSAAQPEVYVVEPEASRVRVHLGRAGLLKFLGHEHEIDAPIARGRIEVDPDDPGRSRVDLTWEAPLLAIVPGTEPEKDVPAVEERMRGPEVLDVARHAEIRFWSLEVGVEEAAVADGLWKLLVRGGLELKGARYTVDVPLEVRRQDGQVTAAGEVKLHLRRLGIDPPSVAGVVNVKDEFSVVFEVHARLEGPGRAPGPPVSS